MKYRVAVFVMIEGEDKVQMRTNLEESTKKVPGVTMVDVQDFEEDD